MSIVCPTCGNQISDSDKQSRCPRCNTLIKENIYCDDCQTGCEINFKIVIND